MEWQPIETNQPLKLVRFARDGEKLFKIYDYGDDWCAMTYFGDGRSMERIYSKWHSKTAESLLRAEQATAPGAQWTST